MSVYIDKEKFCGKCKLGYDEQFFNKKCPSCERKKYEIKRLKRKEGKIFKFKSVFIIAAICYMVGFYMGLFIGN